jgi:hypothetical protein
MLDVLSGAIIAEMAHRPSSQFPACVSTSFARMKTPES